MTKREIKHLIGMYDEGIITFEEYMAIKESNNILLDKDFIAGGR